jgi:hypothetical protein
MITEKEINEKYNRCDHKDKSEFVNIICAHCKTNSTIITCKYCADKDRAHKLICYDCVNKLGTVR